MKSIDQIVAGLPIEQDDRSAHFRSYLKRSGKIRRGEFDVLHILFDSIVQESIREVIVIQSTAKQGVSVNDRIVEGQSLVTFPLPIGYDEFLSFTNGAYLFGGNLILFGLRDNYPIPNEYLVRFRPPDIAVYNTFARNGLLNVSDVHIGSYFYSQRLLIFNRKNNLIELTKPFSRHVEATWGSFSDYAEMELAKYAKYFDARGRMLPGSVEFSI